MSNQNVFKNTLLLTLSGILAKTIDFSFRAYYSKLLGSVGMGLFSLVFSVHGIMLTVATAGLSVAISKTVSEQLAARRFGAVRKTMRTAIIAVSVLSLAVIALTIFGSKWIAVYFLRDERTALSLCLLAPSILFMSISYCIKGYFYAARKVIRPASSEFLEQAVKITVISALLKLWLPKGVEYGCCAVFLGLSIGEFSSCAYLSVLYWLESRRLCGGGEQKRLLSRLLKISVPTMTNSLTGSFLRMQEDVWIVSGFRRTMSKEEAMGRYGEIQGMVLPLLMFPLSLFSSFVTLLVPEIARADSNHNQKRLVSLISRVFKFGALAGTLVMCVFSIFSDELAVCVYGTKAIAPILRTLAFLCPVMVIESVSCGILNGLGQQFKMLKYSLIDSCVRLSVIYFLVPLGGVNMLLMMIAASNLLTCSMVLHRVFRLTAAPFEFRSWVAKPALSAIAAFFITKPLYHVWIAPFFSASGALTLGILTAAAVYLFANVAIGGISKADICWVKERLKPVKIV